MRGAEPDSRRVHRGHTATHRRAPRQPAAQENTPVGTTFASSRSEMCSASSKFGAIAASDNATGATANDVMIAATAKPVTASGLKVKIATWPMPKNATVTTPYTASNRPRFSFVAKSLSHDSATTYKPAVHKPVTNRSNAHATGLSVMPTPIIAADSSDASAEYTRMWPTRPAAQRRARPDKEADVVAGANQAADSRRQPGALGAHTEQRAEQPTGQHDQREADEQPPRR